jgi:hypothetical protein
MISSGIGPATFRLVAQCLNQLRYPMRNLRHPSSLVAAQETHPSICLDDMSRTTETSARTAGVPSPDSESVTRPLGLTCVRSQTTEQESGRRTWKRDSPVSRIFGFVPRTEQRTSFVQDSTGCHSCEQALLCNCWIRFGP